MFNEIKAEIYRALVLLGADFELLGSVGSWGDSMPDEDVLVDLRAWNDATTKEIRARIEHGDISSRQSAYNQGENRKTA